MCAVDFCTFSVRRLQCINKHCIALADAATSYSEDGKRSRSRSLSRSVDDDEDGDHQTRLNDDEQVVNGQRAPPDGDTARVNGIPFIYIA